MYVPEWWLMPDVLFLPSVFVWVGCGLYVTWKVISWLTPARRHERTIKRIEAEFKIKERRQKLELELAWNKDRYKRDKVFYDKISKSY